MKRFVSVCLTLLLTGLFALPIAQVAAQVVKVKREAMSPNRRSSGNPNYTAPAGPYYISTGLRVVGKGMKVYLSADTTGSGATAITSFAWSFDGRPAGSTAAFDSTNKKATSFTADTTGFYYVAVQVNGAVTSRDTIFASTYIGSSATFPGCGGCHAGNYTQWKSTGHALIFTEGVNGELEVNSSGYGTYAAACIKCHTTGWEPTANNGNFGNVANQTGWDTTWYKPYGAPGASYFIPYKDSVVIKQMASSYSSLVPLGSIGCESCHGPGKDHNGDKTKTAKSLDAGVCQQCHDAPKKHRLGSYWAASKHGIFAEGPSAGRTSCFPCHSGTAFVKWLANKTTPGYDTSTVGGQPTPRSDANRNISCASCHDPHTLEFRTLSLDSLRNGYKPPAGIGGKGLLCMNCHNARYSSKVRVTSTAPYYGFVDRYGPHENGQADVYFGSNGYQYGDNSLTGQMTHAGLSDACVTCHMASRVVGTSIHSNHGLNMSDTTNGFQPWAVCKTCHGANINSFNDVKAFSDYDQDGTIEGAQDEIVGLLDRLKAKLPIDSLTGEPITRTKDSLKVKNRPDLVQNLWNYHYVNNDKSKGVHNMKYAVALLQKALGIYPTDVKAIDSKIPTQYVLNQNYPNPFNPTTTISFSVPQKEYVRIEVYDILGKLIKTIVDKEVGAGNYSVVWEGNDQAGAKVASGMYLYRIQAGSFSSVKKMLMLK